MSAANRSGREHRSSPAPARAIRAAHAIQAELAEHGLAVRVGLHTGEVELVGHDIGGIAVHIAARIMSQAGAGAGAGRSCVHARSRIWSLGPASPSMTG